MVNDVSIPPQNIPKILAKHFRIHFNMRKIIYLFKPTRYSGKFTRTRMGLNEMVGIIFTIAIYPKTIKSLILLEWSIAIHLQL